MSTQLKSFREELNLSQAELANRAGITNTMISMLESGTRQGSHAIWDRLEAVLGVSKDQLRQINRTEAA
jgi:transcriptional regulator with XRE-family HTH domain